MPSVILSTLNTSFGNQFSFLFFVAQFRFSFLIFLRSNIFDVTHVANVAWNVTVPISLDIASRTNFPSVPQRRSACWVGCHHHHPELICLKDFYEL